MYKYIRTIAALIGLAAVALAAGPARAGVATGTLFLSIRIVNSCDVRTRLPGETYPTPPSAAQVPRSHSTCNDGTPAPRVTTTVLEAPAEMPAATKGNRTQVDKGRTVKIVTIYF
jgi:hypothetical protein